MEPMLEVRAVAAQVQAREPQQAGVERPEQAAGLISRVGAVLGGPRSSARSPRGQCASLQTLGRPTSSRPAGVV